MTTITIDTQHLPPEFIHLPNVVSPYISSRPMIYFRTTDRTLFSGHPNALIPWQMDLTPIPRDSMLLNPVKVGRVLGTFGLN